MSSRRRLDLVQTQSSRDKCRSPMPSSKATKKKLTFQEVQALNSGELKGRRRTPEIQTAQSSPLTQRIRQQILQTDQEAKTATTTPRNLKASTPLSGNSEDRRQRLERNMHRLGKRQVNPSLVVQNTDLITPVGTGNPSFFTTPSPNTSSRSAPQSLAAAQATPTARETSAVKQSSAKTKSFRASTSKPKKMATSQKNASSLTPPLVPTSKATSSRKQSKTPTPQNSTQRTPLRAVSNTPDDDDNVSTRRNLDKRSARLRYSGEFHAQISKYKQSPSLFSPAATSPVPSSSVSSSVQVYVRKRPIFPHETARGDFDVVSMNDTASSSVVVYRTQMAADMKQKLVQPVAFGGLAAAFDSNVDSQAVYDTAVAPLVEAVVLGKAAATLLMFGQTGSGKTYTMSACQERVAHQLFAANSCRQVQVQSIELAGKNCRDLMVTSEEASAQVKVLEQEDGSVRFVNAASAAVSSAEELNQLLTAVKERRATQATRQNDESSRSHAVYQIRLHPKSSSCSKASVLTLVDCAGTERRNDSIYHCRERQAESAEINASLYALKECIRRKRSNHVPYRQHLLTRVLRESLESDEAPLAVIATVAPNATDTEHTLETLKTVCTLTNATCVEGEFQKVESLTVPVVPKPPKQWTHEELLDWMARKHLEPTGAVAAHLNGRTVMRMSKVQLRNAFFGDGDVDRADSLFRHLRAETDRVARMDLKRRFALKTAGA